MANSNQAFYQVRMASTNQWAGPHQWQRKLFLVTPVVIWGRQGKSIHWGQIDFLDYHRGRKEYRMRCHGTEKQAVTQLILGL